jgi:alanyl-tRNA synthetase
MTERLYYHDSSLVEFDAAVVDIVDAPGGGRGVVLDRTAFYPTSGGQPHDTGTLGGVRVLDVIDRDDGTILHLVDRPVAAGPVHGSIDAARRLDHVQQHSGQHLLSAAFDRTCGARTVSFHLGAEASTIDLDREVTAREIDAAESAACDVVWADRPVTVSYVDEAGAAALALRKPPARGGRLRIVDMDGYDLSACGGTHVARTGTVGIVAVTGAERVRGGSRVSFVCGGRALRTFRMLRASVDGATRLVSVLPDALPAAVERLQTEARDLRRQLREFQAQLASHEAERLVAAESELADGLTFVAASLDGWDAAGLKAVASGIVARPGRVAVLFSAPAPAALVVARSADITSVDSAAVLRQLVAAFGGKGGGRPDLAQGGGLTGGVDEMLARARSLLRDKA